MIKPDEILDARRRLGELWGLGRPVRLVEIGRVLGLKGRDPGKTFSKWETGEAKITGPASRALEAMLDGWMPRDIEKHLMRGWRG